MKINKPMHVVALVLVVLLLGLGAYFLSQETIPCSTIQEKVLALYDEEKVEFECGNFELIPFEELPKRSDRIYITDDMIEETKIDYPNLEDAFVVYEGNILVDGVSIEIECIDSKTQGTFDCLDV